MLVKCLICSRKLEVKPSRGKNFKTCSRECFSFFMTGHRPFNWKGGRLVHKGYVYILCKEHPTSDRDGYVPEHRIVMEKSIGHFLENGEVVHHKNGKRDDNRIENLALMASQSEHMSEHWPKGKPFWAIKPNAVHPRLKK